MIFQFATWKKVSQRVSNKLYKRSKTPVYPEVFWCHLPQPGRMMQKEQKLSTGMASSKHIQKAMENGAFIGVLPIQRVILYSYVSLPEGMFGPTRKDFLCIECVECD